MIRKIAKVAGFILLTIVFIALVIYGYAYFDINRRKDKLYDVAVESIRFSYDSASLALGERLVATRACKECHGDDLGGRVIHEDAMIGKLVSRNITKGEGGLPADYSAEDWVMAMKHGLGRDRKPLYLMPSHELSQLTQTDMAAIIAYCSQLPPVDRKPPQLTLGPLGYILSEFNLIPLLPAEFTDHNLPFMREVKREVSIEYGQYLSTICINCHGKGLKGGKSPVPGGVYVADITSTGNPGKWTAEQFIKALHTGETPEGKKLNPADMPWTITKNYTEDELKALHLYLKSLK